MTSHSLKRSYAIWWEFMQKQESTVSYAIWLFFEWHASNALKLIKNIILNLTCQM